MSTKATSAKSGDRQQQYKLIRELFPGKLDIIGDVHGEAGALATLLDRLGYDGLGRHRDDRKLVFVGDLVDRGPNSVGVVDMVRPLVESGNAQLVLGNHELNLLRQKRKHGNHWFYGETEVIRKDKAALSYQVLAPSDEWRASTLEFLSNQPLVLERKDICVVHAAWNGPSIAALRAADQDESSFSGLMDAMQLFEKSCESKIKDQKAKGGSSFDISIECDLIKQNGNPVKVVTSGLEERVDEKFFAGGKWRWIGRRRWWNQYVGDPLVVIGHYWRRVQPPDAKLVEGFSPTGGDPFEDCGDFGIAGGGGGVMCVDYSVGVRYEERGRRWPPGAMGTGLAALRYPERTLLFDDGRTAAITRGKADKESSV